MVVPCGEPVDSTDWMVAVDDDRLKGFDKGVRWVSFSSDGHEYFAVSDTS